MYNTSYLYHTGVKGRSGRYPWGSGSRPYQRLEKPKRIGFFKSRKQKKAEKQRAAKEDAIKKAQQEKKEKLANKEKIIKSGKASDILAIQDELTVNELNDALNRVRNVKELSKFSAQEIEDGWKKMNDAMGKVKDVNNWATTGMSAYNTVSTILDFLNDFSKASAEGKDPSSVKFRTGGGGKGK